MLQGLSIPEQRLFNDYWFTLRVPMNGSQKKGTQEQKSNLETREEERASKTWDRLLGKRAQFAGGRTLSWVAGLSCKEILFEALNWRAQKAVGWWLSVGQPFTYFKNLHYDSHTERETSFLPSFRLQMLLISTPHGGNGQGKITEQFHDRVTSTLFNNRLMTGSDAQGNVSISHCL